MKSWVKLGLFWGIVMFLIMGVVYPLSDHKEITLKTTLIGLLIWLGGGLLFGYIVGRKKPQEPKNE